MWLAPSSRSGTERNGATTSGNLRGARSQELRERIAGDLRSGRPDTAAGRASMRDFAADQYLMGELKGDQAADPFTGAAPMADLARTRDTLSRSALTNRPEQVDAAHTVAEENAFAQFLKEQAGHKAAISAPGQAALDAASGRKIAELEAGSGAKLANQLAILEQKGIKPSAASTNALTALNDVEMLAPTLLKRLEEKHPGINVDPAKYGGVGDTVAEKAKRFAYGVGLYQPDEDIGQMTQLMRVIASRPYMAGRPNQRIYDDIVSHLGEFGFSPGADYARIKKILELSPELREGIELAEQPIARRKQSAPGGGGAANRVAPAGGRPNVKVTPLP